jgi:transcriptional regulator with XRE-family HTH domain
VKRFRIERNLSQEKLAELAGFHRTYVSQLERCVANISIDGLERLAISLSVDVTDLLAKPMWSANEAESVAFGLRLPMP